MLRTQAMVIQTAKDESTQTDTRADVSLDAPTQSLRAEGLATAASRGARDFPRGLTLT